MSCLTFLSECVLYFTIKKLQAQGITNDPRPQPDLKQRTVFDNRPHPLPSPIEVETPRYFIMAGCAQAGMCSVSVLADRESSKAQACFTAEDVKWCGCYGTQCGTFSEKPNVNKGTYDPKVTTISIDTKAPKPGSWMLAHHYG